MKNDIVVVDRGVDEVLIVNHKEILINNLKGKRLIKLLNDIGITKIQTVSFDEYEESGSQCQKPISERKEFKPAGISDVLGQELYEGDIFEESDGTRWEIYYDNQLLSWQVAPVNNSLFSHQGLCEFVDRTSENFRIDGVKLTNH